MGDLLKVDFKKRRVIRPEGRKLLQDQISFRQEAKEIKPRFRDSVGPILFVAMVILGLLILMLGK